MHCKKDDRQNFAKFKGTHLCGNLFLIKLQVLSQQLETLVEVYSSEF